MAPPNPDALPSYEQLKQRAEAALSAGKEDGAVAGNDADADADADAGGVEVKARPLVELSTGQAQRFRSLLRSFQHAGAVMDQALALYVNSKVCGRRMKRVPTHGATAPPTSPPLQGAPSSIRL